MSHTNRFFEFIQKQSERHFTKVPHEVLAIYYAWYGEPGRVGWKQPDTNAHQIANTAHYPLKGPYSSHDRGVLEWQIEQAKTSGITGFIVSWMGTGPEAAWIDQSIPLLLEIAEKKDFKISIYYEQAPGQGQHQIGRAIQELSYMLDRYGRSKAFLKLDGKPVVFAYARVMEQVPVNAWPEIIEGTRQKVGDFVFLADDYQPGYAHLFDGIHTYDPARFLRGATYLRTDNLEEVRGWIARYYGKGVKLARQRGRIACALVNPGYDARKAYQIKEHSDRRQGATYRAMWEEALKANVDWIIITSWNEWLEGTEIEPSLELSDTYLRITADFARPFLNSPAVDVPTPPALARAVPGNTPRLDTALHGSKMGVLLQDQWLLSDAEVWARYCGAEVQRLAWKDLIDPNVFNASNFSVILHVATEHYTSSVRTADDVTRALIRYLHEGGFFVSLPMEPAPLYFDDSRGGIPRSITDTLSLGVDNGFEQRPSGVDLTFHVNTRALPGLKATAEFPSHGDLRWRPANRARAPRASVYTPLIQLTDGSGRRYGEAAVYIEHRTVPLSPGKTLYVWMRTAEAFGPENFYPALMQFIATKLGQRGKVGQERTDVEAQGRQ